MIYGSGMRQSEGKHPKKVSVLLASSCEAENSLLFVIGNTMASLLCLYVSNKK